VCNCNKNKRVLPIKLSANTDSCHGALAIFVVGSVCNPLITVDSRSLNFQKIEFSDKPENSHECESLCYKKLLGTESADFTPQLEITRHLNLLSIYIQSGVTSRNFVESG